MVDGVIRRAKRGDAAGIGRVIVEAWKTSFSGLVDDAYSHGLSVEKYTRIFEQMIDDPNQIIFVVLEAEAVIGFASGRVREGGAGEIDGLYLLPACQGLGLGKALFVALINEFREQNCTSVFLWTLHGARNNRFYDAVGARPDEFQPLEIGGRSYPGVKYTLPVRARA